MKVDKRVSDALDDDDDEKLIKWKIIDLMSFGLTEWQEKEEK